MGVSSSASNIWAKDFQRMDCEATTVVNVSAASPDTRITTVDIRSSSTDSASRLGSRCSGRRGPTSGCATSHACGTHLMPPAYRVLRKRARFEGAGMGQGAGSFASRAGGTSSRRYLSVNHPPASGLKAWSSILFCVRQHFTLGSASLDCPSRPVASCVPPSLVHIGD